jgi:hypothetical protein
MRVRFSPGTLRDCSGCYEAQEHENNLSIKHLDAYLDELEYRFNNRKNKLLFRDTLFKLVKAEKLPYLELTKAA